MSVSSKWRLAAITAIVCCTAAVVWANVPEPKRPPRQISQNVPFVIRGDRTTKKNKLIIPKKFLKNAEKVSAAEESGDRTRTVVAGILLSLGAVCLVFVAMKRKNMLTKTGIGAAVALAGSLITIELATADIAPPIRDIPQQWRRVAKGQQNVDIVIVEKGEEVELVLGTYYRSPSRDRGPGKRPVLPKAPEKTGEAKPKSF